MTEAETTKRSLPRNSKGISKRDTGLTATMFEMTNTDTASAVIITSLPENCVNPPRLLSDQFRVFCHQYKELTIPMNTSHRCG